MGKKEKLLRILKEINPDVEYETETALVDDGIFDSLEVMTIVTDIEDVFRVSIDPEEVIAENFNSLEMMLKLIDKTLEQ